MRVIAGSCRGRRLAAFAGRGVRPTSDRAREALFSILQTRMGSFAGVRVLDLFAGSGALAIEALSRGAASAYLVDRAPDSLRLIRENLARCQLTARATVLAGDAWQVLQGFAAGQFELIFADPPYGQGMAERAVVLAGQLGLLAEHGLLCVESAVEAPVPDPAGPLHRIDQRRYGSTMIHFYTYATEEPA